MKKNITVKVLASFLGLSLALVGCSNGGGGTTSSTAPASSAASTSSTAPEKIDPEAKYEKPVVVKIAWPANAATGAEAWDGHSNSDNPWTELLLDKYNIKIEVMWEANKADGQYKTKLDLAIASNQLPDIIHTANYSQFTQLAKNDKVEDLTSLYENYMSEQAKELVNQDDGLSQSFGVIDGKTMGLSTTQANYTTARLVYVRADWMKELNIAEPKSMDDVIAIGRKFVEAKKAKFALPLFKKLADDNMADIVGVANSVGATPRLWIDDGKGNAIYGSTQPEMKKALQIYADLYKDGLIDPAFASLDGGKVGEQLTSGQIGVVIGAVWLPSWPLNSMFEAEGVDWNIYSVTPHSTSTTPIKLQVAPPLGEMMAVKKGFSNPETLFKITNIVSEKLADPDEMETYHSYKTADGVTTVQVFAMNPLGFYYSDNMTNFNTYKNVTAAIDKKDESLLKSSGDFTQYPKIKAYTEALAAGTKPETGDWVMAKFFYGEGSGYSHLVKYFESDQSISGILPGYQTPTMELQWGNLTMLEDQYLTEIISGTKEVDKGFDEFVSAWNKQNGEKITAEVNEWYKQ